MFLWLHRVSVGSELYVCPSVSRSLVSRSLQSFLFLSLQSEQSVFILFYDFPEVCTNLFPLDCFCTL